MVERVFHDLVDQVRGTALSRSVKDITKAIRAHIVAHNADTKLPGFTTKY